MTLIGALQVDGFVIIAGDTRVSRASKITNELSSRFDKSQKVLQITDNIFIGLAGDYKAINILKGLSKHLNKNDWKGDYFWSYPHESLIGKISEFIKSRWNHDYEESDFFVCLHDMRDKKRYIYKVLTSNFSSYLMDQKFNLIGSDSSVRAKVSEKFQILVTENKPNDITSYGNLMIMAMKSAEDITIGPFFIAYGLNANESIIISNATGYINETNEGKVEWIGSTVREDHWTTIVNGEAKNKIINDWDIIKKDLGTKYR